MHPLETQITIHDPLVHSLGFFLSNGLLNHIVGYLACESESLLNLLLHSLTPPEIFVHCRRVSSVDLPWEQWGFVT